MGADRGSDIATLAGFVMLPIIFAIGLFLQFKIIKGSMQDRTTGWEINLSHTIVMLVHFSFVIVFESAIHMIPDLNEYLENWVCSAIFLLRMVGAGEIMCHSLTISFYKYIFIVHHNMVVDIGIDRMKTILRLVYLLIPIGGALSYIFRPNFHAFKSIHNCGAHPVKTEVDIPNRLFMCGTGGLESDDGYDYFMNFLTGIFCSIQTIISMLIYLNILEVFFYIGIFRHMKR